MTKLHKYILSKIIFFIIGVSIFSVESTAYAAVQFKKIMFDDLAPRGFQLDECWFGVGIDHTQKVYVGLSDRYGSGPDDVAIFRFDPSTGKREFLSTARQISQSNGNLQSNETIAKIHDTFKEHNGKMYFSTHDFHAPGGEHRGGHFYEYDLTTGQFDDLSRHDTNGISIPDQGIHRFVIDRSMNKLIGITYPDGDIVVYDINQKNTKKYNAVENTSQQAGIFGTENGKVYFAYAGSNKNLYVLDLTTGAIRKTGNTVAGNMHSADVLTRDGATAYTTDSRNNIYRFNVTNESLVRIGSLPSDTGKISAHTLSNDEKYLYVYARDGNEGVFEINLATNTIKRLSNRFGGLVTGGNIIDNKGRVYACFHGDNGAGLIQITNIDSSVSCEDNECINPQPPDPTTGTQCHTITSGTAPTGFGVPYDTMTRNLLIKAECANNQANISLGDNKSTTYIWPSGYQWSGSAWQTKQLRCTGQTVSGWCVGGAETTIQTGLNNPDYFVGYVCQWNGSKWRCGCRDSACTTGYWQLQGVRP